MPSWMAWATRSPEIRPARVSAMSMPEETPAAVTYLPSNTTRSLTGVTPNFASWSTAIQYEVARRPVSRPAAARISEPVHTEVVHVLVWSAARSQACRGPSAIWSCWPGPPGTTMMSGCGTSVRAASADTIRRPSSSLTRPMGPGRSAAKTTSAPGSALSTW
jgi:hypothetical protein